MLRFLLQSSLAQIDARYGGRGYFPYGSELNRTQLANYMYSYVLANVSCCRLYCTNVRREWSQNRT